MLLGSVLLSIWVIRACKGLLEQQQPVQLRMLEIVDKMTTIAAAHDVMAYQGIQAMAQPVVGYPGDAYDPSDEAEARREAERRNENFEDMSDGEQQQLRDLFA